MGIMENKMETTIGCGVAEQEAFRVSQGLAFLVRIVLAFYLWLCALHSLSSESSSAKLS